MNKSKDEVTKVVSPVKNIVISNKNIHYKSNFKNKTKLKKIVNPDETVCYKQSHLALQYLQRYLAERVHS